MKQVTKAILLLLLYCTFSSAQESNSTNYKPIADIPTDTSKTINTQIKSNFSAPPTIGLGTGLFSFYGDVYSKHLQSPTVSRIAYDLSVSQQISENFQFNFYVLFGKLGANERLTQNNRNINFESQIRAGGINIEYNFGHFLPASRTASPYITLGVESFEFLSKTDAYDQNGNKYYYWTDGTIRNIDQSAPNAANAVLLKRDYTYESDIREMNKDGFGKYAERSFAIPLGLGARFKINDYFYFKLGTTMHFTFTDYIDGITFMSKGSRQGDNKNDKFMMTSCSIHYNLGKSKRKEKEDSNEERYKDVDFFALDQYDYDKDGITDPLDSCQCTPLGVTVDYKGCPIDDDADCYANYKDNELNSPPKAWVDIKGVQLNDSSILAQRTHYLDESLKYAKVIIRYHKGTEVTEDPNQQLYSITLGTYQKGLPAELMTKFLSIPDISSSNLNDSTTIYTVGIFNNLMDANFRKQQLIANGLTAKLVYKQFGRYINYPEYTLPTNELSKIENTTTTNQEPLISTTINKVEEVEPILSLIDKDTLGTKKSEETEIAPVQTKSEKIKTIITATVPDSVAKKAEESKQIVVQPKVEQTKRVEITKLDLFNMTDDTPKIELPKTTTKKQTALQKNTVQQTNTNKDETDLIKTTNLLNVPGVVLRVQIGAWKKPLSKKIFRGIHDLIEIKTDEGFYKYMTGSFNSFDDAAKHKLEMNLNGYPGAFITAYKDGKRITLKEAGATPVKTDDKLEIVEEPKIVSTINKDLIEFKVQVGVFKNQPPDDKLIIFTKLKDVTGERTVSGLTRYVAGTFSSYKEADTYKNEIIKIHGVTDPFVVALFNKEYISIQEALELLK
jgi:hypothetical protein